MGIPNKKKRGKKGDEAFEIIMIENFPNERQYQTTKPGSTTKKVEKYKNKTKK